MGFNSGFKGLTWNILHLVYRFCVNKQTAFPYTVLISGIPALLKWWHQSLTSVNLKNIVVWSVTSCTIVEVIPLFRRNILPSASGWNFIFECGRNIYLRNRCLITLKVKVSLSSYRPAQIPRAPGGWTFQIFYKISTRRRYGFQPYAPAVLTSWEIIVALCYTGFLTPRRQSEYCLSTFTLGIGGPDLLFCGHCSVYSGRKKVESWEI